jgi:hypothetical protein
MRWLPDDKKDLSGLKRVEKAESIVRVQLFFGNQLSGPLLSVNCQDFFCQLISRVLSGDASRK